MKRALLTPGALFLFGFALVAGAAFAASSTTEVLVLSTASTRIPHPAGTVGMELQNLGPNAIWCALGVDAGSAVVNKSRKVDALGGTWAVTWSDPGLPPQCWCIAQTADQVTGAATAVTHVGGSRR